MVQLQSYHDHKKFDDEPKAGLPKTITSTPIRQELVERHSQPVFKESRNFFQSHDNTSKVSLAPDWIKIRNDKT
jgi:hypothetical protein